MTKKDDTLKELNRSLRRCKQTLAMINQIPLSDPKRTALRQQTEQDIKLIEEVREKLMRK